MTDVKCPWDGCDYITDNETAIKTHHYQAHGESMCVVDTECGYCNADLTLPQWEYDRRDNCFCQDTDCRNKWFRENRGGEDHPTYIDRDNPEEPWQEKDVLEELYVEEKLSAIKIADRFDCSRGTIEDWLHKHNIETRVSQYAKRPWTDKATLEDLYVEKQMSMKEVADEIGCSEQTVCDWLAKHGIKTRDVSSFNVGAEYKDKDKLQELYVEEDLSAKHVGEKLGCDGVTVLEWIRHYDIDVREARSGEDHYAWVGTEGRSDYGPRWQEQREKALQRDGYKCQHTGITREEHYKKYDCDLPVHHIIPLRLFDDTSEANHVSNLVTLSEAVHKTHEKWIDVVIENSNKCHQSQMGVMDSPTNNVA